MKNTLKQIFHDKKFIMGFIIFIALKRIMGLRVTKEEERQGLDLSEHGESAYAEFLVGNEEE